MTHSRSGRLIAKRSIYIPKELFAIGVDVGQTPLILQRVSPEPSTVFSGRVAARIGAGIGVGQNRVHTHDIPFRRLVVVRLSRLKTDFSTF